MTDSLFISSKHLLKYVSPNGHYCNFCERLFGHESFSFAFFFGFGPSLLPVVPGSGCLETAETFGSSDGEI